MSGPFWFYRLSSPRRHFLIQYEFNRRTENSSCFIPKPNENLSKRAPSEATMNTYDRSSLSDLLSCTDSTSLSSSSFSTCQSLLSTYRNPSSTRSLRMARVSGLMSPHPGANVPFIVAPSHVQLALYAICFRFCKLVSQVVKFEIVEYGTHLYLFNETISDYPDEAPASISSKCPGHVPVLVDRISGRSPSLKGTYLKDIMPRLACPTRGATRCD